MKFFVTGVGGQLGHDVMNEVLKRGHEGVGSDIQENLQRCGRWLCGNKSTVCSTGHY